MSTKLAVLRQQLATLRRARQVTRWGAAYSATATAKLWLLAALWGVDVVFELSVAQRAVMIALAVGLAIWSYVRFTKPLLGPGETEIDLALEVQRRHGIDSDLVAALQFESPEASGWGSSQLEAAVIDRVAKLGTGLDVFAGFSRVQLARRGGTLAVTLVGLVAVVGLFPQHAAVFVNRLLLGHRHYPTDTVIERVVINDQVVLAREQDDTAPRSVAAAQGQVVHFYVAVHGAFPELGHVRVHSVGGGVSRQFDLTPLSEEQRRARLLHISNLLIAPHESGESPVSVDERAEYLAVLECESPAAAQRWRDAEQARGTWDDVRRIVGELLIQWSTLASRQRIYHGELGRLVDSVEYKLRFGDAWTDPAQIRMTPRPAVELRFTAQPPSYARQAETVRELGPRQLSVLEGTDVDVGVECTNGKRLSEAWLALRTADGTQRIDLVGDDRGLRWKLPATKTAFVGVQSDLRFTVQVVDQDGLSLETPLAGLIRIKPDRPPLGSMDVVHRVVLPNARPKVNFRANDDYGIGRLLLHLEVEQPQNTREPVDPVANTDAPVEAVRRTVSLLEQTNPVRGDQLPLTGQHEVALAPLQLTKGHRLKLTLEVVDDRGERPGQSYLSEPLYLEISDEAGVLSAILEADERSEQRLSDIIKRQLGIGESPK